MEAEVAEATAAEHQLPSPLAKPVGKVLHLFLPVSLASEEAALRKGRPKRSAQLNPRCRLVAAWSASDRSCTRFVAIL